MNALCERYPGIKITQRFREELLGECDGFVYEITEYMSPDEWREFYAKGFYNEISAHFVTDFTALYADTSLYSIEFVFYVPDVEWSGFEKSPLFREIAEHAQRLYLEKQDRNIALRSAECKAENKAILDTKIAPAYLESLSALLGRLLDRIRFW